MKMRCLAGLVVLVAAAPTAADTVTVCLDGTCDHVSIQAAIDAAQDGDIVQIAPGLYAERVPINPDGRSILVTGTMIDGVPATILDGNQSHRVIICDSGEDDSTEFTGLVIQNGLADGVAFGGTIGRGGGMLISGSSPRVTNCIFRNNVALERGGAIANRRGDFDPAEPTSNPTITNCVFHDNQAPNGGAIRNDDGSSPIITDCLFRKNSAVHPLGGSGGAIDNWFFCEPTIFGCDFIENETNGRGGAVANWNAGQVTIIDCLMEKNMSGEEGGGAIFESEFNGSATFLEGTILCTNMEPQIVGPWQDLGENTIQDACLITVCHDGSCDFSDIQDAIDSAFDGAEVLVKSGSYPRTTMIDTKGKAIRLTGETNASGDPLTTIERDESVTRMRLIRCISGEGPDTVVENINFRNGISGNFEGGGMLIIESSPTLHNCRFIENQAEEDGGAIWIYQGNPSISSCRFISNHSDESGGAVHIEGGSAGAKVTFTDCDFISNFAGSDGAGVSAQNMNLLQIIGCRFENGDCPNIWGGGGGISCSFFEPNMYIESSTFCGNTPDDIWGCTGWDDGGNNTFDERCQYACASDINGDDIVDGSDLNFLLASWGTDGSTVEGSDINGDGLVDGADLNILLGAWGDCP